MARLRLAVRHVFNPLHVFCRLRDAGVRGPTAMRVCRLYERWFYNLILTRAF
ncbi:hypothetical protein [Desulfocurvibacter africanus]|uniref:Uncharacterized protein n=1 Tax=Desulfocurvibacter africanus subsp. africanus str. Walvis Bay TaxID=690850 RepID=F3YVK0_DESAF|nr:hypothetical protein [Desulfocurvibacter africanus]EGJ48736.1 hypothetical protein Desaf_0380 [Desulfocurvibacter africanus subsp. africanus str. Walvis Bay]